MKKSKLFFIAIICLIISSCNRGSYYKDSTHSTIRQLYNCELSITKSISASTEDGKKTTLIIEIKNSKYINNEDYDLDFAGSLIPLLTYKNLSKEGLEEITHIETKIIQNLGLSKSEHTFTYPNTDLDKVSKSFDYVGKYITGKKSMTNDELSEYFDLNTLSKDELYPTLDKLKEIDTNNGGVIESNIIGFKISKLENGDNGILLWNYIGYEKTHALIQFVHPYVSKKHKIIGFELL